jgi:hypothetical protein
LGIKRIVYPDTGIYQRKVRQVELGGSPGQNIKNLNELTAELHTGDRIGVDRIELEATEFLNDYVQKDMGGFNEAVLSDVKSAGVDYVVQNYIDRVRNDLLAEFDNDISVEEKREITRKLARLEQAADGCQILCLIATIRMRLENSQALSLIPATRSQLENRLEDRNAQAAAVQEGVMLGRAFERFRVRSAEPKALTGDKILKGASAGGVAAKESSTQRYREIVAAFRESGLTQGKFSAKFSVPPRTLRRALKKVGPTPSK